MRFTRKPRWHYLTAAALLMTGGKLIAQGTPEKKPDAPAKPAPQTKPEAPKKPDAPAPSPPKTDGKPTPPLASPIGPVGPVAVPVKKMTASDYDTQGYQFLRDNKLADAIKAFQSAIALDKADVRGIVGLAQAYDTSKQPDLAIQTYRRAIDLRPNVGQFQFGLATTLLNQDKYAEARAAFVRAVELGPDEPYNLQARLSVGQTYQREGEYDLARAAHLRALGFAPDNPAVHSALGEVYTAEKRYQDALDEYEVALRVQPDYPPALSGAGDAMAHLGRGAEAEKRMREWVTKAPKASEPLQGLAQVLDTLGKHDDAVLQYVSVSKMTPEDPYLWGNMGWSQYGAGKYDEAIASSRKALTYDNKLPYVRFNLGLIYAVQNKWTEAQKEYAGAVAVASLPDVQSGIGDVRDALAKQPTNAALRQALSMLTAEEAMRLRKRDELAYP